MNGIYMTNSIDSHGLIILNRNTRSHFDKRTGTYSNLDLAIVLPSLLDKISVNLGDDPWGSDHFPPLAELDFERNLYEKKTFKIKSKQTG